MMRYISTRDNQKSVTAAQAILQGISTDGGLFVPEKMPQIDLAWLASLCDKSYNQRAVEVLKLFLTDYSEEQIVSCVNNAYTTEKFDAADMVELAKVSDSEYLLELWRGPTCAFKDMALQLLPQLLTTAVKITGSSDEIVILVATSGDTGKAALEGFKDVPGTRMLVFYPVDGVSPMQKRQMCTQEGSNVKVCAIKGNFDDAQTGVKTIFGDEALKAQMAANGKKFSSANSINWGRLVPQVIYYVSSYCQLMADGEIKPGEKVNVCVPTGNFGNILAAYYAKCMGVPFNKFICASNRNHVLTDFLRTGVYDRNRDFHATISPSMDILISSNLERLLHKLCCEDDAQVRAWFDALKTEGRYEVSDAVKEKLHEEFYGGFCDDAQTKATIHEVFADCSYLCDTHTAVAVKVYRDYKAETGDNTKTIIASTASPYKFANDVLAAVNENLVTADEYENLAVLSDASGVKIPKQLASLKEKPVLHTDVTDKAQMADYVRSVIL